MRNALPKKVRSLVRDLLAACEAVAKAKAALDRALTKTGGNPPKLKVVSRDQ